MDLLRSTANFCEDRVSPDSIYGALHRECFNLFPDELFADLFTDVGRRSVLPMIVAVVILLQRIEGLSDREAVERSGGRFAKDRFTIDPAAGTVTCPADMSAAIRPVKGGGGVAAFGTRVRRVRLTSVR